jgi:hypothetical protein
MFITLLLSRLALVTATGTQWRRRLIGTLMVLPTLELQSGQAPPLLGPLESSSLIDVD